MPGVVHHAIKRFGSPPAAIPRRATRRVATRQMPQAYPPQRGSVQHLGILFGRCFDPLPNPDNVVVLRFCQ
jgi:hypothetical protein